ncbi:hypothetical protein FACS1894190_18260 [Spirochaetia bacterium]|nr:hypothetical protein FACS1894190_18260 [Spirochaetia bacterium]
MYPLELHEFRTPYLHNATDLQNILLTQNEIDDILNKLNSLRYSNICIWADSNLEQFLNQKKGTNASTIHQEPILNVNYTMRINADGKGNFGYDGSVFDINEIDTKLLQNKISEIYNHEPSAKGFKTNLNNSLKSIPLLGAVLRKIYRKFKSLN